MPDFSTIAFTVNGSKFPIGDFINQLISFLLIAVAVYFFVIMPVNALVARLNRGEAPPDPTTKKCPECLSDVAIGAKRCAYCTWHYLTAREFERWRRNETAGDLLARRCGRH